MPLTITRVAISSLSDALFRAWAALYCAIWKEPPWNEEFWTIEGVIADIRREMTEPDAAAFLAVEGDNVVGFTLGYGVSRDKMKEVAGHPLLDPVFTAGVCVFYIDELGVDRSCRGRGIGARLSSELLLAARESGHHAVVLRTDVQAYAARTVYTQLGFQDLRVQDAEHQNRTYWFIRF